MVLELQKQQQYMVQAGSVQAGQMNASNTTSANNSVVSGGELGAPVDELNANNAKISQATTRTVNQLYDSIASICIKYGLDINEAKKTGFLSVISGKTENELLNASQAEIQNIIQKMEKAINAIYEDIPAIKNGTEKLTFDKIKNYVKLLNGEVPVGWDSVDSFRKAQRKNGTESLAERLKRYNGFDVKGKTPEQIAVELEAYFDSYFKSLSGSRKEVDNLQLTDFTKLLFNSTQEEYEMFANALEYLVNNNKADGLEAILESFDNDDQRLGLVKKLPDNYAQKIMTAPDQRGEVASAEQAADFVAVYTKYMDKETFEKYHETSKDKALNFYNQDCLDKLEEIKSNPEIIKDIQAKLVIIEKIQQAQRKNEDGEKLTTEEIALLEHPVELTEEEKEYLEIHAKDRYYRGDSAGQAIGIGINKVICIESKQELIETINYDAYQIGEKAGDDFYRNVLIQIVEYTNSLPEGSKEAFVELMEKAIGENYTNITNNRQAELNAPALPTKSEIVAQATQEETTKNVQVDANAVDPRYSAQVQTEPTAPLTLASQFYEACKSQFEKKSSTEDNEVVLTKTSKKEDYYKVYGGAKAFNEIRKEFGTIEAVKFTFDKQSNDLVAMLSAVKTYKGLNCTEQFKTIKGLCSGLGVALDNAKESTLKRLSNVTLRTFGATKLARKAVEESLSS